MCSLARTSTSDSKVLRWHLDSHLRGRSDHTRLAYVSLLRQGDRRCPVMTTSPSSSTHLLVNDCSAFKQPDAVLGALWYPTASLSGPATYCFVASVRDCPVRLIDASSGRTRASYPIVDHRERFVGPQSMAFNADATK